MCHELARRPPSSRRYQPDQLAMVVPDESHCFGNIAVVADHDRAVVGVQPAVVQEMHSKIDVRAFFLGPDHLFRRPSYNIAVLKCQIDVAPLTSSLFHVPHSPSNRTPATLV